MTRLLAGAVVVAVLLATAGCNAPLVAEDGPSETTTVTPAPLPGALAEAGDEAGRGYPPGVGPDGVTDAQRLVAGHEATLHDTSYTVRLTTTREAANGSVQTQYVRELRVATPVRFHYVLTVRDARGQRRIERWRAGDEAFAAETTDGERTYDRLEAPTRPTLVTDAELNRFVGIEPSRLAGTVTRNGSTLYRLVGGPSDVSGLSNVSYVALVDSSGRLASYTVTYEVSQHGETRTVRVEASFEAVGETTVERPPWYDEAT